MQGARGATLRGWKRKREVEVEVEVLGGVAYGMQGSGFSGAGEIYEDVAKIDVRFPVPGSRRKSAWKNGGTRLSTHAEASST